jgi:hypothetical protein
MMATTMVVATTMATTMVVATRLFSVLGNK